MTPVIETTALSKRYGHRVVLNDVSFKVDQSEICALIGPNGAGKSSLIRIILGLNEPTSGSVALFGKSEQKDLRQARERIGYVPDTTGAYLHLSAANNMRVRCAEWGLDSDKEVERALRAVGLEDCGSKTVSQFSLGMKRRLDIGTALLGRTDLLVLDEPANGLDPLGIEGIWSLIKRLNEEQGTTLLVSSHDLTELSRIATSYLFICGGRLQEKVSSDEVRRSGKSLRDYYRHVMEKALS